MGEDDSYRISEVLDNAALSGVELVPETISPFNRLMSEFALPKSCHSFDIGSTDLENNAPSSIFWVIFPCTHVNKQQRKPKFGKLQTKSPVVFFYLKEPLMSITFGVFFGLKHITVFTMNSLIH